MSGLILLRIACVGAGFILVGIATVLYEDEEGVIQNKLEGWWIVLTDTETQAVRKHVAFVAGVAALRRASV